MEVELKPTLSIIMPVHNEEACLERVILEIQESVLSRFPGSDLLAVDDGSRDSTPAILDSLSARFPRVVAYHKENGGHGDALLYGLRRARGRYLFLMDSDGQTCPDDFWNLWKSNAESEFICGVRSPRHDPIHRLAIARVLRAIIRIYFGVRCRDANVPFKLMSRDFWRQAEPFIPNDTLTPSLFLSIFAGRTLARFGEVEIRHRARETGSSTIRTVRLLRFCLKAFCQMVKFHRSLPARKEA